MINQDNQMLGILVGNEYDNQFFLLAGYYPKYSPTKGIYPNRKWATCIKTPKKPKDSDEIPKMNSNTYV